MFDLSYVHHESFKNKSIVLCQKKKVENEVFSSYLFKEKGRLLFIVFVIQEDIITKNYQLTISYSILNFILFYQNIVNNGAHAINLTFIRGTFSLVNYENHISFNLTHFMIFDK